MPPTHEGTAELVDAGELTPSHNHRRLAKVNMAFVSLQERHPEDSILFELADNERHPDSLIPDTSRQFNYSI